MSFEKQKKDILTRSDKSKKGSIDEGIKPLIDLINSLPDHYTTSTCAGRILLIEITDSGRKDESKWVFIKHSKVSFSEIKKALADISDEKIWLRQESMIIHICCRDLDSAKKMLSLCWKAGLKRTGMITIGKKIIVETFGTERLDTIIAEKGNVIVSDDYLRVLIREANKKYTKNTARIERLYKKIKELKK
ncbi:MAG: hypothetical protein KAQ85_09465 [Thermodesulfovibrionia bacterium]|nr:hypothetical protein [Thermodesulfovibrionia bacterium]